MNRLRVGIVGSTGAVGLEMLRLLEETNFPVSELSLFASERSVGSVSYTHLRAHETVLDLVCRLLLEKKKKQRKKTA